MSLGGDLTEDHDHTSLGGSLAGDLGVGVLGEAGVEDGVRDLVTDLVGVALTDGLGLNEKFGQTSAQVQQRPPCRQGPDRAASSR